MDPFKFIKDNTYGINSSNIPPEKKVDKLLIFFSSVCAATAVQPIPFADIFILTPIQLYMGTLIAEARGYNFERVGKKITIDLVKVDEFDPSEYFLNLSNTWDLSKNRSAVDVGLGMCKL